MPNSTISVYDKIAEDYAASFKEKPEERELILDFLASLPEHPAVLDAGCGNSDYFPLFHEHKVDYTGIDLSEGMIEVARRHHPQGRFLVRDMRETDFPPGDFDGVFCFYALIHLNDHEIIRTLASFSRLLKPGGKILASFQEGEGEVYEKSPYLAEGRIYLNLLSEDEIRAMLEQTGFHPIRRVKIEPASKKQHPYNKILVLAVGQ